MPKCDECGEEVEEPECCGCGVSTCGPCWAEHVDSGCELAQEGPEK
jgi:hypothetical protein